MCSPDQTAPEGAVLSGFPQFHEADMLFVCLC